MGWHAAARAVLEHPPAAAARDADPARPTPIAQVDAYEVLGAEKGWSREEAESEVVRYLCRKSLAVEGGFEGGGQDYASFALLTLLIGTLVYNAYMKYVVGA